MAIILNMVGIYREGVVGTPSLAYYTRDTFLDCLEDDLDKVFFGSEGQDFTEDDRTIKYYHSGIQLETSYPVIFDNPSTSQKVNLSADFNGLKPQIQLQESKLKAIVRKNDTITVRGIPYHVEEYTGDGVGVITIFLRRK